MKTATVILICFLVLPCAGCGKQTSTFSGKVTYQGRPITNGVVYFLGPAPKMQMGMGTIHDDGTYIATDVPVGEVRVSFQAPGIPEKYADPNKSELIFTITAKMKTLDINLPEDRSSGSK
jgi:hypothetical protein